MYKLEVIKEINYSNFNNLASIKRAGKKVRGKLFCGDTIEVKTKQEAEYLCGNNPINLVACKIIEEKAKKTSEKSEK